MTNPVEALCRTYINIPDHALLDRIESDIDKSNGVIIYTQSDTESAVAEIYNLVVAFRSRNEAIKQLLADNRIPLTEAAELLWGEKSQTYTARLRRMVMSGELSSYIETKQTLKKKHIYLDRREIESMKRGME